MSEIDPQIDELQKRLDALVKTQIGFQSEITAIRNELARLAQPKWPAVETTAIHDTPSSETEPISARAPVTQKLSSEIGQPTYSSSQGSYRPYTPPPRSPKPEPTVSSAYVAAARANLEEFIGKNLISLIGVIILMLGVGIGVKFAIDKGLISPALRVAMAYAIGVTLIIAAIRLKPKYLDFSAVLISGGAAIMYFVTYYAYAAYFLIPQPFAFVLMAIFTALTVAAAIIYNRQVIAHIGLVGAYAVPFLLSDGSGNYFFLFVYMTIINAGILAISVTRYWRALYYTSFVFTWLIFGTWLFTKYDPSEHLSLAVVFSSIFFAIFYAVSFVYRLWFSQTGMIENAGLIFTNSFVFYGLGYAIVNSREDLRPFLGLFTAAHGIFHALMAQLVNRFKANAVDVVQVLAVLIITFTTIAVPVQLDGNYVTLVWAVEAAALFYFGRVRRVSLFEYFSYPLMFLASVSLLVDWITSYAQRTSYVSDWNLRPFLNGDFVTALVFVVAFAFIYFVNLRKDYAPAINVTIVRPVGTIIGAIALVALYNTFRVEISNYHNILAARAFVPNLTENSSMWDSLTDHDIERFNTLWQLNYTMLFLGVLAILNVRRVKSGVLAYANIAFGVFVLFIFLTVGMNYLYELRLTYMNPEAVRTFGSDTMNVAIRYISYVFAGGLLVSLFQYCRSEILDASILRTRRVLFFEVTIYPTIFIAASCELSNLMAQFYIADASKLGLSILWGVYALSLIVLGIAWSKKHLRIAAIVIFAVTLVKLFFYDISDLPTIPKTILFVSLGLLLLLVSFLYNKYKNVIFPTAAEEGK